MRILYCSNTYPPHLNGESIFTQHITEGMAKRGHEVVVLVPAESGYPKDYVKDGVRIVRVPAFNLAWINPDLRIPIMVFFNIRRIFKDFQPQVVHLQDISPLCQAALHEAHRLNISVIMTHHSGPEITAPYLYFKNPVIKRTANWFFWNLIVSHLNKADLVTVPSKYSAKMLKEKGLKAPVQSVPCGVNLTNFKPDPDLKREIICKRYGIDPEKILFCYVGRIDPEKNIDVIIKAFGIIKRSDIELVIAGHGAQEAKITQLTSNLGLNTQIHLVGQVDQKDLPDLINSSDVFIMPGIGESFSIACVEAMACSKPILAANSAALPELVKHSVNGYLFEPLNPESLAHWIEMLIKDRQLWPGMGKVSLARASQYNLDSFLEKYDKTYTGSIRQRQESGSGKDKRTGDSSARSIAPPLKRGVSRMILALILFISFFFSTLFYDQVQAHSFLRLSDLAPIDIRTPMNMLVIAPHPDDELLAAGGIIQRVLETGGDVTVALVTNGDGQYLTPYVTRNRVKTRPADYIDAGRLRQTETVMALEKLGLSPERVVFLGYPDNRINNLWHDNWQLGKPIQAPLTNLTSSVYENTYNHASLYLGSDLVRDLREIVESVQPVMILIPHPEDTNLDHSAVSNFAQYAIADYLATGQEKQIVVYAYLVHYGAYPLPRNENGDKILLPPAPLSNKGKGWVTFSLNNTERSNKKEAMGEYVSQLRIMPKYLHSFTQANEIFFTLPIIGLPMIGFNDQEVFEKDTAFEEIIPEPSRERFNRLVLNNADLASWNLTRLGKILCFGADTQGPIGKNFDYRILGKLPDGTNLMVTQYDDLITFGKRHFGACFNLNDLGNPRAVGFSAETRAAGVLIDRTAWHFVYFPSD